MSDSPDDASLAMGVGASDSLEKGAQQTDINMVEVDFDGESDLTNPQNWTLGRKWTITFLISLAEFVGMMATIICAPVAPQILSEFHSDSQSYRTLMVSIWELGEVLGPVIIAPVSELYGRFYVYHAGNTLFVIFSMACALSTNIKMLMAFRFLSGVTLVSVTLNPSIVGDLFPVEQRGLAMSIVGLIPMLGPVTGPLIGSYLGKREGWRWVFWLVTITMGTCELCFVLLFRETYKVQILKQKTKQLCRDTGNMNLQSKYDAGQTTSVVFRTAVLRPMHMLFTSPILLFMSLYVAVVYGYLYLLMTTITEVFETVYGFSEANVGLSFLGMGVGFIIGVFVCGFTLDYWVARKTRSGSEAQPEHRLPPLVFGGLILPIGLFLYGWTADAHVQWMAPIIGTGILGLGLIATTIPVQSYLVDAFGIHAASAIAASTVVRNISGAVLPLAGPPLYNKLGLGWGNSVLGFIALAFTPVPLLLMKFGERLRSRDMRKIEK